jgi:hypothetical protein
MKGILNRIFYKIYNTVYTASSSTPNATPATLFAVWLGGPARAPPPIVCLMAQVSRFLTPNFLVWE